MEYMTMTVIMHRLASMSLEVAIPAGPVAQSPGAASPLTGKPPARTPRELAALMRACGAEPAVLEATASWLLGERRQSPRTQAGYVTDLSRWVQWSALRGIGTCRAPATEADNFAAAMRDAGHEAATRARRISSVSSWYAYLERLGIAGANPFGKGMDRPKVATRSKTKGMSEDELDRMLAYARLYESARTSALLTLMATTACRVSSVIRADIGALGHDKGHAVIDLPVKGGDTLRFVMPALLIGELDRWLPERGGEPGPLFVTAAFKPLDQPSVYRTVQRTARKAGVAQWADLSPHSIRHTVLTILFNHDKPTHIIQDLAGHADGRTTKRYDLDAGLLDRSPANELGAMLAAGIARHEAKFKIAG